MGAIEQSLQPAKTPLPKVPKIPRMTVRRLSDYYRILRTLESQGDTEPLSSEKMSRLTGFTAPR